MVNKNFLVFTLTALCGTAAFAQGDGLWGSNSFSDKPRHGSSPGGIVQPFSAHPSEAMSTIDSRPGYLSRALHEKGPVFGQLSQGGDIDVDNEVWSEDRTVYRSSAPERADEMEGGHATMAASRHSHFTAYGDDIAALKGLQLELALNHLHHLNQSQIGLAKMAESRATTPAVLNLAHQIRADHERMEMRVEELAERRDVRLEGFQLSTYEQVVKNRLESLDGEEFETAFLRVIDRSHDMHAADLEMIRDDVADQELTAIVDEALPSMHAHQTGTDIKARASTEEGDIGE